MKTVSILLQTLCVPCGCRCRYCLLSWDGHCVGADYERSQDYARKFSHYIKEHRPEMDFHFTFGYSMEHPNLPEALDFLNEIGSVQGRFLQLDGMRLRSAAEADQLMEQLTAHGVKSVNFTFYGLQAYHDRFAARNGDFDHLLTIAKSAAAHGLETSAGIPLTVENADQAEQLITLLEQAGIPEISVFIPHEEGRGVHLAPIRFTLGDWEQLGPKARDKLNRKAFRPEGEWVSGTWPEEQHRALILSLAPENIGQFEAMDFAQVICYGESLDEQYYASLPSFAELCRLYGNPGGDAFYSKRDLFRHYQMHYIADHNLTLYDVTDERFCGSRRF